MFPTDEINEEGVYAVEMTKNGEEVHIVLDDFIPCKDHRPAFSSANGNELWVLLLEKHGPNYTVAMIESSLDKHMKH